MDGQQGFTLLELMVTLAIVAIVLAVGTPSFSSMIQDNRLSGQAGDFLASLNLARSEAIKRGARVTLCKSNNDKDCTEDDDWEQGWIVFVDTNQDGSRDIGEDILRVHEALSGRNTLVGNRNVANTIAYLPNGFSVQNGTLSLCDPRHDEDKARAIVISRTGRARSIGLSEAKHDGLEVKECA